MKAFVAIFALVVSNLVYIRPVTSVTAEDEQYLICSDIMFIFARGSGAEVNSERDFVPFKQAVDDVFGSSDYSYNIYELGSRPGGWSGRSYPAPGIGISSWDRFDTSIGALLSGGDFGAYGDSVEEGSDEAMIIVFLMESSCPNTKIVLAGYSQGAQVVSRTLQKISPNWIYAALTFGDPKLYLPEGRMNIFTRSTTACRGESFSEYRAFVPDCYAYEGILGGYKPYRPSDEYIGKIKAYCQFHDVICSARIDLDRIVSGHATYAEQGTYKRAIQDLYNMLEPSTYNRPSQDLAILFDTTGSMGPLLSQFKSSAIKVAKRVLKKGGKVALYTYGDLEDTDAIQLCSFETCNGDNLVTLINDIEVNGGGDTPESLLSASYKLMRELRWDIGATKSLVVLTDADYHNPDRDGITLDDVVELSKSIDPVNFYILTDSSVAGSYSELAERTDGAVYTSDIESAFEDIESEMLSQETPEIYISSDLPEAITANIFNLHLVQTSSSSLHIDFESDGVINFLTLNDYFAGFTEESSIEIVDLDLSKEIVVCISAASENGIRGEAQCISTAEIGGLGEIVDSNEVTEEEARDSAVDTSPKAPNTGRH